MEGAIADSIEIIEDVQQSDVKAEAKAETEAETETEKEVVEQPLSPAPVAITPWEYYLSEGLPGVKSLGYKEASLSDLVKIDKSKLDEIVEQQSYRPLEKAEVACVLDTSFGVLTKQNIPADRLEQARKYVHHALLNDFYENGAVQIFKQKQKYCCLTFSLTYKRFLEEGNLASGVQPYKGDWDKLNQNVIKFQRYLRDAKKCHADTPLATVRILNQKLARFGKDAQLYSKFFGQWTDAKNVLDKMPVESTAAGSSSSDVLRPADAGFVATRKEEAYLSAFCVMWPLTFLTTVRNKICDPMKLEFDLFKSWHCIALHHRWATLNKLLPSDLSDMPLSNVDFCSFITCTMMMLLCMSQWKLREILMDLKYYGAHLLLKDYVKNVNKSATITASTKVTKQQQQ